MAAQVNASDYVEVAADSGRCVDERGDKSGENLGWQAPGAGLHVVDLLRVAGARAGEEISEMDLWEMAQSVFESEEAKSNKIVAGVHIDDEHGHISDESLLKMRNKGCGYDSVRNQVLERLGASIRDYEAGGHILLARERGWGVQVLTGEHVGNATAAVNNMKGRTLKTQSLLVGARIPSFNYDIWAVEVLLPVMEKALKAKGYEDAAEKLSEEGVEMGRKLYAETLDILTHGRLNEGNLIEIE